VFNGTVDTFMYTTVCCESSLVCLPSKKIQ